METPLSLSLPPTHFVARSTTSAARPPSCSSRRTVDCLVFIVCFVLLLLYSQQLTDPEVKVLFC